MMSYWRVLWECRKWKRRHRTWRTVE